MGNKVPVGSNNSEHVLSAPQGSGINGWAGASASEFPFAVALKHNDSIICGGSIYSTLLILTAAHCVMNRDKNRLTVLAGVQDERYISSDTTQIRSVRDIYIHEEYDPWTRYNDIALLSLNERLRYTPYVKNITLLNGSDPLCGNATAVGWDATMEGSRAFEVLKNVKSSFVSLRMCRFMYRTGFNFSKNIVCTKNEGQDRCQIDGGGMLIYKQNGTWVQCGLSALERGCWTKKHPRVYTQLAPYMSWIFLNDLENWANQKCTRDYFYCVIGKRCIPRRYLCDGDEDCGSEIGKPSADETGCKATSACQSNHFRCNNGLCIKNQWVCDGDKHCSDSSDEYKCSSGQHTCSSTERKCGSGGRCIPKAWWCDKQIDCEDNSDEKSCVSIMNIGNKTSCETHEFHCATDSKCIPRKWVCDGTGDCSDRLDENSCGNGACNASERKCTVGERCIPETRWCDGQGDCEDNSDEQNCMSTTIATTSISTAKADCAPDEFYCSIVSRCMPKHWVCDGVVDCSTGLDELNCDKKCSTNSFFCRSSRKCISRSYLCDSDKDCIGNEDEVGCNSTEACDSDDFRCNNFRCITKKWLCDNDDDCSDGSDELKCRTLPCSSGDRQCGNDGRCIPEVWWCDGQIDCDDRSDENNCGDSDRKNDTTYPFIPFFFVTKLLSKWE